MNESGQSPRMANLYATREGQTQLANELGRVLDNIEGDRKNRGSIRPGIAKPNQIKRFVIEALSECGRHGIGPPKELVLLVRRLLQVGPDANRRELGTRKIPALFRQAARIQAEAKHPLSSRKLAAALRNLGHPATDRTIANYIKDPQFATSVKRLKAVHRQS